MCFNQVGYIGNLSSAGYGLYGEELTSSHC
jgi:hypothetical protein